VHGKKYRVGRKSAGEKAQVERCRVGGKVRGRSYKSIEKAA
jgi:hypothetical protein